MLISFWGLISELAKQPKQLYLSWPDINIKILSFSNDFLFLLIIYRETFGALELCARVYGRNSSDLCIDVHEQGLYYD